MSNNFRKSIALLVLNYNGCPYLEGCLKSLLSQTYKHFKVYVIDNKSTDGSVGFIKKHFSQVSLIENFENFGVGKGFNDAIKTFSKEFDYIGLFNPDIKVDKNWLKESVSTLDNYPEAEICASLVLDWRGKKIDTAGGRIINFLAGVFGGFLGNLPVKNVPPAYKKKEFPVFFGVVTAMLVRASAFKKFGFFDEDYFMYFEDVDFSWRVLLGGGKIYCNPKAVVYHYGHGSKPEKGLSLKLLKQTEINLLATYFKNLSSLFFLLVFVPLVVIRVLASFLYLPISPKITLAKISGICLFLTRLFFGQYRKQKIFVSYIRKLTDRQVLALNPTSLFSFTPLVSMMSHWFSLMGKVYNKQKHYQKLK